MTFSNGLDVIQGIRQFIFQYLRQILTKYTVPHISLAFLYSNIKIYHKFSLFTTVAQRNRWAIQPLYFSLPPMAVRVSYLKIRKIIGPKSSLNILGGWSLKGLTANKRTTTVRLLKDGPSTPSTTDCPSKNLKKQTTFASLNAVDKASPIWALY